VKISAVTAQWLQVPMPKDKIWTSGSGTNTRFDMLLVRVRTEDGLEGLGEARGSSGAMAEYHALKAYIEQELAPLLVGQDAGRIGLLWQTMYNARALGHSLRYGRGFPILARRGIPISGISAVDMALWDLRGKVLGQPVHALLGGKLRDRLPAYASGGWAPEDRIGEELLGYVEAGGFKAVKMRVDAADGDFAHSARRVHAARKALGDGIEIMCDGHGQHSVAQAKRFCREVSEARISWFEEPVSPDNKPGCAEVRASTDIPIASGERESTRFDFRELIDHKAVDILQPDLGICGGITEAMRVSALAATYELNLAPHLWGGALVFHAGLHFAAASPSTLIVEYCLAHNPLLHELAQDKVELAEGQLTVPDRPGLGVSLNEAFVKRYTL